MLTALAIAALVLLPELAGAAIHILGFVVAAIIGRKIS
jgi:hypothetical protein